MRRVNGSIIQRYTKDDIEKRAHKIYKERIALNPPSATQTEADRQKLADADWARAEDVVKQIQFRAREIGEDRKQNPGKYAHSAGELSDWLQAEKEIDFKGRATGLAPIATAGMKTEYVPDVEVGLHKRFAGVAGQGIHVIRATTLYGWTLIPDPPPHPDAGMIRVDANNPIRQAPQGETLTKRGTFWDANDPNYRTDHYGVSDFQLDPMDPNTPIMAVARDDVRETTILQNALVDAEWKPSASPLFPAPHPLIDDLQQGSLADCGLLAALGSVMVKDSNYVKVMMHDNGRGTVTVRLFDINEVGAARPHTYESDPARRSYTFTPRFIEVDKSQLVFKAEEEEKDVYNPGQVKKNPAGTLALNKGALWVQILEKAYIAAGYLSTERQRVPQGEAEVGNIEGGDPGIAFEHLVGKPSTPEDVKLAPSNVPPAAALPSIYPADQLATFNRIRQAVNSGKLVAAWTEDKVQKVSSASASTTGHSGGEDVAEGLVGQHAYTVVACDPPSGQPQPNAQYWITVRNPWGHYGREYNPDTDKVPTVTRSAESRIELSDFVTQFKRFVSAAGP